MTEDTCVSINCPGKRQKPGSSECMALVIVGTNGIGYCPKCRIFYRIKKRFGLYYVKPIHKSTIEFEFLPFKLEN
jgi:hypothetical protein